MYTVLIYVAGYLVSVAKVTDTCLEMEYTASLHSPMARHLIRVGQVITPSWLGRHVVIKCR